MNFVDLLRTAVANTFRSKLRTTLTVIAIFIGAFTITLTSAIGTGVSNYIDTQVASIGDTGSLTITKTVQTSTDSGPAKYDPDESSQSVNRGPATFAYLSQSDVDTIRSVSGVRSVRPAVALSTKWVEYADKGKYVVDVSANAGELDADLAAGKQLDDSSAAGNQVLLPTNYLKNLGLGTASDAVGKRLTIAVDDYQGNEHTLTATVAGVQNESLFGGGAGANAALTDAMQAAQETGKPASIATSYASATATLTSGASVSDVKHALSKDGYTGQTTEFLQLPGEDAPTERAVGVPTRSLASVSLRYVFQR